MQYSSLFQLALLQVLLEDKSPGPLQTQDVAIGYSHLRCWILKQLLLNNIEDKGRNKHFGSYWFVAPGAPDDCLSFLVPGAYFYIQRDGNRASEI